MSQCKPCKMVDSILTLERRIKALEKKAATVSDSKPCSMCSTWTGSPRYTFCPDCGFRLLDTNGNKAVS